MRKKVLTMAEYIEREALRNSVESIDWYNVYKGKLTAGAPNTENALYKASSIYAVIDNAPAADVAPVVHGRWQEEKRQTLLPVEYDDVGEPILHDYVVYRCDRCERTCKQKEPYCHCGAKMEDGANE